MFSYRTQNFVGLELEPKYVEIAEKRIASIPPPSFESEALVTPSKRDLPRVSFGQLIEAQYLKVGQLLYSKSREFWATIKVDSQLIMDDFVGSIHKVAAKALRKSAHNGWEFWYYEDDNGQLVSIDNLRDKYRKENDLG